jgi:hypothetical protein
MGISLRPETQKLIEERMTRDGYPTPDDVVLAALESLDERGGEELDPETLAALDRADLEIQQGRVRDFKEVAAELRKKYLGK